MTRDLTLPMPAAELTLHRPPMLLVERLVAFGQDGGVVEAGVTGGGALVDPDGSLEAAAMVELIAQAYAVVKGYHNLLAGLPQRMGYLVGIRSATVSGRAEKGDLLQVAVQTLSDLGPFQAARGEVLKAGRVVAEAEFKVWMPEEADDAASD